MVNDRLDKLRKSLQALQTRRFQFAEAFGTESPRGGEKERHIEELLKVHEAIKVMEELIAEEEKMRR
jgi:hypothetical protein